MIDYSYWFMFFVGIVVASLAMSTGIGGATFFSPIFIGILKLDLKSAITAGIFIEFFGFLSGVIGYYKKNLIDFNIIKQIILYSIIGVVIGTFLMDLIPKILIKIGLSFVLLFIAYQFFFEKEKLDCHPHKNYGEITKKNLENKKIDLKGKILHFIGGIFFGLSSTGLGSINEYNFLKRLKLKLPIASGTSVLIVASGALIGGFFHILNLNNFSDFKTVFSIVIFTIPGVVIGAQLGVFLSTKIKKEIIVKLVAILFIFLVVLLFI